MSKPVHTTTNPNGDGWINQSDGKQIGPVHPTKVPAVDAGRDAAKSGKSEHVIHNADGTIGEKNSYGNDPSPPKDQS